MFKKIIYLFLTLFFYILSFPIVIIIRIISPFFLIRWHCTISTRIGHYAQNINLYLCEEEINKNFIKRKHLDIFYDRKIICNEQLRKMWHRHKKLFFLPYYVMHPISTVNEYIFDKIIDSKRIHDLGYYRKINQLEDHLIAPLVDVDITNSQAQASIQLNFEDNEIKFGLEIMKKMGIKKKIVSIIIRDEDYLKANYPTTDWSYQSHRATHFKYFKKTALYLAEKGYSVVLFGKIDEDNFNNENIINYSTNKLKSNFMDIFLLSKSHFAISSVTGLDSVPFVFKIPVIEASVVPFGLHRAYSDLYLALFKTYFSKTLNRKLSMKEIFENGLFNINGKDLEDEIEFIHPSEEDILDSAKEMIERLNNKFNQKKESVDLQNKFKENYKFLVNKYMPYRPIENYNSNIVGKFLERNQFLLD